MSSNFYLNPEDTTYVGGQFLHNLLMFGRVCKILGMNVTPNRMIEVARALQHVDLAYRPDVYYAMRALIVKHKRDIPLFDEAFDLFWARPTDEWTTLDLDQIGEEDPQQKTQYQPQDAQESSERPEVNLLPEPSIINIIPTYSDQEILRHKDFAEMTGDELAMAQRIMERLPRSLSFRQTRRNRRGKGQLIDLRGTLRKNLRYAGETIEMPTLTPRYKPRPLVLICDISGSMERYTRVFLHFMHTFANSMHSVESFVFSANLTRITHPLRLKSVDRALTEVGSTVEDWGGGTKIGEAIRDFNYRWSRRVLGRGAVVLLITDGWDRGDPDILRHETRRLQHSCHRLVWLNPLLGIEDYQPLTRGAQAMLPHVHDFLPLQNLANLEMVLKALQDLSWVRRPQTSRELFRAENA